MIKQKYRRLSKLFFLMLAILTIICISSCKNDFYFKPADVKAYKLAPFSVCYIDVGQGDCSLIQCGGEYMLIDSGEDEYYHVLNSYIDLFGVDSFKYVIITHPHSDHMGGMNEVMETVVVRNIIMPDIDNDTKEYELLIAAIEEKNTPVHRPFPGDVYLFGDAYFTILAPMSDTYEDMNNYSIVLKFDYMDTSFLFTGDCQIQSEEEMLQGGYNLDSDVLKVAHHGSSTSSAPSFINRVSPIIGIIQAGAGNSYGHPHRDVLDTLEENGVSYYCTADCGSIIIISDGHELILMREKVIY